MLEDKSKLHILPLTMDVDGFKVHLLEVLKNTLPDGTPQYFAVVRIEKDDFSTRNFTIPCRSTQELKAKLMAEIAKIRYVMFTYGKDFAKKVARP